ncbi:site-2 protease family protein [Halorientalis halophila]|uniref:site-2 protease family protein n=1 Tax=Halorientalis halophila TaxID=3108499 RepID=UPI00300A7ADD
MSTPPSSTPASLPPEVPDPESLPDFFRVYDVEVDDGDVRYYGELRGAQEAALQRLAPLFRERGYRVRIARETGEHVLVATERSTGVEGVPWTNVLLFCITVGTTLLAGARWYGLPVEEHPELLLQAWPFALSVLTVLGIHEFGHYALSRYHEVEVSLPYFIPMPNFLGTWGAVIRMREHIPSRRVLFDIGVAGPLAGLGATIVVTAIGVSLPPVDVGAAAGTSIAEQYRLGYPPLIQGIALVLGEPLRYSDPSLIANPVVIGGWVGAFVTFLNLLPVGQLDGAHVLRALIGDWLDRLQLLVPLALFGLAAYTYAILDAWMVAGLWGFWGLLALLFTRLGGADPLDQTPVDARRQAVAAVTLVFAVLTFTPTPIVFTGF